MAPGWLQAPGRLSVRTWPSVPAWSLGPAWFPILLLLLVAGCSGTKHLPEDEKLYTGAETVIESDEPVDTRKLEKTVNRSVRPAPNSSIFGMRPKLWLYMAAGEEPSTGHWPLG